MHSVNLFTERERGWERESLFCGVKGALSWHWPWLTHVCLWIFRQKRVFQVISDDPVSWKQGMNFSLKIKSMIWRITSIDLDIKMWKRNVPLPSSELLSRNHLWSPVVFPRSRSRSCSNHYVTFGEYYFILLQSNIDLCNQFFLLTAATNLSNDFILRCQNAFLLPLLLKSMFYSKAFETWIWSTVVSSLMVLIFYHFLRLSWSLTWLVFLCHKFLCESGTLLLKHSPKVIR